MLASEGNPENPRSVLPLAAMGELAENSRQGFTAKKINSHPGWSAVNFKTAPGIGVSLRRKGIRSRCQSLNRYAYVLNNPATLTDPLGLCGEPDTWDPKTSTVHGHYYCPVWGDYPNWGTREDDEIRITKVGPGAFAGLLHEPRVHSTPPGPAPLPVRQLGCSVGSTSTSFGQYLSGAGSAASMLAEFLSGRGPGNLTFGPQSVESQMMSSSPGVTQAVNNYENKGESAGLYTFGLGGLWDAGANPIQQFVGSYRYSVVPTNGGLNVSLTNRTGVWSGSYHLVPNHPRSTFGPLGNTYQTYQVFVPCHN